jgi:hypothetical protein
MAISAGHLILGQTNKLSALLTVASCKPKPDAKGQARQVGSFLQRSCILDKEGLYSQTPRDFLHHGYEFMEVKISNGLWARWVEFKSKLPRLVLLTRDLTSPADGFAINLAPSLVITPTPSEADSETETESSTFASEELISNSAETSESCDDQGGMGTVAMAVAHITIGRLTAMPNVKEKDVSISARNHEPDSFSQFLDNHERRPIAEEVIMLQGEENPDNPL